LLPLCLQPGGHGSLPFTIARRVVVFNGSQDFPESTKPDGHEPTFGNGSGCANAADENRPMPVKLDSMTKPKQRVSKAILNPFDRPASWAALAEWSHQQCLLPASAPCIDQPSLEAAPGRIAPSFDIRI
jgi:hypothetical protein